MRSNVHACPSLRRPAPGGVRIDPCRCLSASPCCPWRPARGMGIRHQSRPPESRRRPASSPPTRPPAAPASRLASPQPSTARAERTAKSGRPTTAASSWVRAESHRWRSCPPRRPRIRSNRPLRLPSSFPAPLFPPPSARGLLRSHDARRPPLWSQRLDAVSVPTRVDPSGRRPGSQVHTAPAASLAGTIPPRTFPSGRPTRHQPHRSRTRYRSWDISSCSNFSSTYARH